jgi:hypothetical protein
VRKILFILFLIACTFKVSASSILIPMGDGEQKNHLKAYGIAFWILQNDIEVEWLLQNH